MEGIAVTARGRIEPKEWLAAMLFAVALVWVNLYICRDLFRNQMADMNSMHGFWVALARSGRSLFHSSWWPYWDGGIPFEFTYAPLVPELTRAWAGMRGVSQLLAFQSITGTVYSLGPLTLFVLAWLLTRSPMAAFIAGLFYSLTAPTQIIVPDAEFAWKHFWDARRLFIVGQWDDTPHFTALTLFPLAVLFLAWSLEKRQWRYYVPTVLLIALMAAASEFGPSEMALGSLCLLFAFPPAEWRKHAVLIAALGIWAYAMVAPFLSPAEFRAIAVASQGGAAGGFAMGSLGAAAIVVAGWCLLWLGVVRRTEDWGLRFAVLFAFLTSSVPVLGAYLHLAFLPQPGRYKVEMELAIALLLAFGWRAWAKRVWMPITIGAVILLLVFARQQIVSHRRYAKAIMQPRDVTRTIEYRVATWSEQNLGGMRVMLPGSIGQWANAFTNVVQYAGGSWSQAMNRTQQAGNAAIYYGGKSPEQAVRVALAWLKAYGVGAIAVNGPKSEEYWKRYARPSMFQGVLPALWSEDDVTIYRVPRQHDSLAHIVPRSALVEKVPVYGEDIAGVEKYVAALDDTGAPDAELRWEGSDRMRVRAPATDGRALSIQVNYHPGWHAIREGKSLEIHRDGLGLMWLDPACQGPCEVQLDYDGGAELRLCHAISFGAMGALFVLPLLFARRRVSPG